MTDADDLGSLADALAAGSPPSEGSGTEDARRVKAAAHALASAWADDPNEERSAATIPSTAPYPPPRLPADFEVVAEIGRGGTGVVYRARQRSLGREVAVKVLKAGDLLFGSALARFEREARALARLRHPHIVAVHEVGSTEGRLWYAMDLVEGRSLAERLREGPMAPEAAARLVADVADAVAYVHGHGLVHRDLKPGNILLDAHSTPYVTDFGLALELGADDGLTLTGQIVGTPAYMSPEQARGETASVGPATDVYALGVVLYECLTGKRPFQGLSPPEQVYAAIHREPLAARGLDKKIPVALEAICAKAMRKRASDRYVSAAAFRKDLLAYLEGKPISAQPISRMRRLGSFVGRHPGWQGAFVGILVGVIGTVWAHRLFGLLAPVGADLSRPSASGKPDNSTAALPRKASAGDDGRRRVRVARAVFEPREGRWSLDPAGNVFLDVGVGEPATLRMERTWEPRTPEIGLVAVVGPISASTTIHEVFEMTLSLARGKGGLVVEPGIVRTWRAGPHFTASGSSLPYDGFPAEFVSAIDEVSATGAGLFDDYRNVRNVLHLMCFERPDSRPAPWSLVDWRQRIAADFGRLADELETAPAARKFWDDRRSAARSLVQLAATMPVPEALGALKRLSAAIQRGQGSGLDSQAEADGSVVYFSGAASDRLQALCLAGDEELLASKDVADGLATAFARDDLSEARTWGRVLCSSASGPLRDLATRRLESLKIPAETADDLYDAENAGRTTIPPSILVRLPDHSLWQALAGGKLTWALVLCLGALVSALRLAWPARPHWKRLVPAAWLVVVGLLMDLGNPVTIRGVDVLPDAAGLALAGIGCAVLSLSVSSRVGRVAAWLLCVGAVVASATAVVAVPAALRGIATWCVLAGVGLLPILGARLREATDARGRPRWGLPALFVLSWWVPLLFKTAEYGLFLATGREAGERGPVGELMIFAMAFSSFWVLFAVRYSAGVQAAWVRCQGGGQIPTERQRSLWGAWDVQRVRDLVRAILVFGLTSTIGSIVAQTLILPTRTEEEDRVLDTAVLAFALLVTFGDFLIRWHLRRRTRREE